MIGCCLFYVFGIFSVASFIPKTPITRYNYLILIPTLYSALYVVIGGASFCYLVADYLDKKIKMED
jgi:hypothetical protein